MTSQPATVKKVLIVDRSVQTVNRRKNILYRSDVKVLTALSGEEALSIHRREPVDLLVVSMRLPDMSTEDLCASMRATSPSGRLPVIATSGRSADDHIRALRCKADCLIETPIDPEYFQEKVSELLSVSPRKNARVLLRLKLQGTHRSAPFVASIENLSSSGFLITTDRRFVTGDIIDCFFSLHGAGEITVKAEIVSDRTSDDGSHRYGARFVSIGLAGLQAIRDLIARGR